MATKVTIKSVTEKYEKDIAHYKDELAHATAQLNQLEQQYATASRANQGHTDLIENQRRRLDETNALLAKTQGKAYQQSIWWYIFGVLTGIGLAALLYKLGVISQSWF